MTRSNQSNSRTIAFIIAITIFMEQLDTTILATALPTMAQDFKMMASNMSMAFTSYLLSLAIFTPISGKIADRFGSNVVFCSSILVFTIGSALCAQAPNFPFLVAARLLQGIGGAMTIPVGRLILLRSVSPQNMVSAMTWLMVPSLIGPLVGPVLGGFIVTYLDWRWIFYINVPIGCIGIILVMIFIDDIPKEKIGHFDVLGMLICGILFGCLLLSFEMMSYMSLLLLATGLVFGILYLFYARHHPDPILDLSLMRIPTFGLSMIAGSLTRITQGAHPFLLPLMFQLVFGLSAAQSGSIIIATTMGALLMKPLAPFVLRYIGFRRGLLINGFISSGGYAICATFSPNWSYGAMFAVLFSCGFFMSFQFTAYNTVAFAEVSHSRMSSATSFYTTFQQLMLSFGICISSIVLHGSMMIQDHATPTLSDFSTAFLVVTTISFMATFWNARFAPGAGADMSGHQETRPLSRNDETRDI